MTEEKYRKILDGVMEQAEKDFGEDINVPNKTELSDEEILQKVEYCISRNGTCNGCKYTMEYHRKCSCSVLHNSEILFNAIHRLHETIDKQKTEIERLHKALDEEFVSLKAVKAGQNSPKAMKMLVESVGCVQKNTAKEILCELLDIEVKDEDYKMFFLDVCEKLEKFAQKYGVEVE